MREPYKRKRLMNFHIRKKIWERDNKMCKKCGKETVLFRAHCGCIYDDGYKPVATVDHIIPFSKGGPCKEDNFQLLCWGCNSAKGNRA